MSKSNSIFTFSTPHTHVSNPNSAHSYQYSFEPNHNWSSLYAPAPEIQAYLARVSKKYSADRFIKLSHQITECRWDETTAKWNVLVKNLITGESIQDQADVLISARGALNTPAWPNIEGLDTFEGEVMHSARWNQRYTKPSPLPLPQ
jgi:cation diffusion facilitator CzcD-associated flavoprotein CzcO